MEVRCQLYTLVGLSKKELAVLTGFKLVTTDTSVPNLQIYSTVT
jgi:hypothetical protein